MSIIQNVEFDQGGLTQIDVDASEFEVDSSWAARAQFRDQYTGVVYLTLKTGDGITNNNDGTFTMSFLPSQTLALSVLGGVWDIFGDPNGSADDSSVKIAWGVWNMIPASTTPATEPELPLLSPPLTNMMFWYAPDSIVASDGVHVDRWRDKSALVQDLTETLPGRQPALIGPVAPFGSGVKTGVFGAGRWLSGPITDETGSPLNTNSFTLYMLVQLQADGVAGVRLLIGSSTSVQLGRAEFPVGSGNITPFMDFPYPPETQALFASHVLQPVLLVIIGDSTHQTMYANGVQVGQASSGSSALSELILGANWPSPSDAYSAPATFYEMVGYKGPDSSTTRRSVEAYFANKYLGGQVVFDGNSQIKGDHSTGTGTAIPGFTPHLVANRWLTYINNGTNGKTTPELVADIPTTAALFNGLIRKRVLVMLEIENDLSINGASSTPTDTTYAMTTGIQNIIDYSRAARAASPGTKLLLCSGLPIGNLIPPPANYEASRQALNGYWRINYATVDPATGLPYFDGFADIGGPSSPVGSVAATASAYYDQADQVHLTDTGVAQAAPMIASVLSIMFSDDFQEAA